MLALAVIAAMMATPVEGAPSHYEVALQCLLAVNEADAIERGRAGKDTGNTASFAGIRTKYHAVILFEGLSLGKTRTQIADEVKSLHDRSDVIGKTRTMADMKAAYVAAFKQANACGDKI